VIGVGGEREALDGQGWCRKEGGGAELLTSGVSKEEITGKMQSTVTWKN